MSLARYIEKKLGVKTRSFQNPLTKTVATSVTKILNNNPDRLSYTIVNLGNTDLHVSWDGQVSTTEGILITGSGGALTLTADEDGELVGYELYGISSTSSNAIFTIVTEGE